jgi:hypothetical protein
MPFQPGRGKLAYQAEVHIETVNINRADIGTILQRLQGLAHSDPTITALTAGKQFTLLFDNIKSFTT